jgi:hypothetical protein
VIRFYSDTGTSPLLYPSPRYCFPPNLPPHIQKKYHQRRQARGNIRSGICQLSAGFANSQQDLPTLSGICQLSAGIANSQRDLATLNGNWQISTGIDKSQRELANLSGNWQISAGIGKSQRELANLSGNTRFFYENCPFRLAVRSGFSSLKKKFSTGY